MKLIDILVEELPKRGGWPKGADYVVQDNDGSLDVKFGAGEATLEHDKRGVWANDITPDWGINTRESYIRDFNILACDAAVAIITREQYEAALAAKNDGWISWGGGECPVEKGTLVDVKWRDGKIDDSIPAKIIHDLDSPKRHAIRWRHLGNSHDIIAYRLHKPQKAAQAKADEADMNECIGQTSAPVWNGEGLPPVGCFCEVEDLDGMLVYGQGESGEVIAHVENTAVIRMSYGLGCFEARFLRPIRTEAERKRDAAVEEMIKIATIYTTKYLGLDLALNSIYDAIAAGEITGVKLED